MNPRAQAAAAILSLIRELLGLVYLLGLVAAVAFGVYGGVALILFGALPPAYDSDGMRAFEFLGVAVALFWNAVHDPSRARRRERQRAALEARG